MSQLTEVVKNLLIINVIMYILFHVIKIMSPIEMALFYPASLYFKPYQLVTHMFMHANFTHLLMNMIGLYFFGPPLEHLFGSKRFFIFYMFSGLGAFLLHFFMMFLQVGFFDIPQEILLNPNNPINIPILGASGAVFGLLVGFGMKFPNQRIMLLFPPIPMKAKVFVLLYAGLELFLGFGGFQTGIAHFAHLGGALFGFLLILYWDKFGNRYRR
jgi:membrane associated rhomboid family serine protease